MRLIDQDGKQLGIFVTSKAYERAQQIGLDLVEISPQGKPPVCKIMDYGKYQYELTKKQKEAKKKQSTVSLKEIKYRPNTDQHDFDFKLRNIQRFLEDGNKVKVTVVFRGREMAYRDKGKEILDKVCEQLGDKANKEVDYKLEGRQMMMILAPA